MRARTGNPQLLILLLVALAGAHMIFGRSEQRAVRGERSEPADLFFPGFRAADADRVAIASGGRRIVLARSGSDWIVEGERGVYADTARVAGALREVAQLSRFDVASVVPGKHAMFGVDDAHGTRVSVEAGGAPVAAFIFGERGPDRTGTYARPQSDQGAYLVPSRLDAVFPLDAAEWRDRRPLRFPIQDSRKLTIEHRGVVTELAVLDDGRWHLVRPRQEPADTRKVERVLVLLAALTAKGYADGLAPSQAGFGGPQGGGGSAVAIGLLKGGTARILFGRQEGEIRYAMTPGRETIYKVSAEMVGQILLTPDAFTQ